MKTPQPMRPYDMTKREDWEAARAQLAHLWQAESSASDDFFIELIASAGSDLTKLRNILGTGYIPKGKVAALMFVKASINLKETAPTRLEQSVTFAFRLGRFDLAIELIDVALLQKPSKKFLRQIQNLIMQHVKDDDLAIQICSKIALADPYRVGTLAYQAQLASRHQSQKILAGVPPITRAVLATFKPGEHINILDGGATASSVERQFADWPTDKWRVFGFDPHPDADLSIDKESNVQMIRMALGRAPGKIRLHHTATGGASSIYKPNTKYIKHLVHGIGTPLIEKMSVLFEGEVDVTDLDNWRRVFDVPTFNFMQLNVQGAELEILKGADKTLQYCMGIQTEVAFSPIYQEAPVFRDVDAFLEKAGFTFFDMRKPTTSGRLTKRRTPYMGSRIGSFRWPSRQITEAHVLYLRDPFRPEEQASDRWNDPQQWLRLAIIAEMNGQADFAMQLSEAVLDRFPDYFFDQGVEFGCALDAASDFYEDFNDRNS